MILQTVALGFDYESFGAWFTNWGKNWINILRNNAGVGIVALGMTFVIISGGIDLAVGSTMVAIGAVIMVFINQYPDGLLTAIGITGVPAYAIGIVAGVIFGCLLGGISGVLIARSKLPAFIATLGMMKILRSVTQQVMQTAAVKVPSSFLAISNTKIGGEVILPILYWLVAAVILHIVSRYTPFGRHVYAVGSNERTARLSGVNVERVKGLIYVLMGALVAVTAVIQVSRIGSMDYANAGSGYEMDAIAAVVVGGTSMSGGRGSILGTVLGIADHRRDEQPAQPDGRAALPARGVQGLHRDRRGAFAKEGSYRLTARQRKERKEKSMLNIGIIGCGQDCAGAPSA